MWFQRYEFLKDPPLPFMGEALGILYNQTFFCSALEYLFIRWMQPTFDILCLTCPCHQRNDHLSASWQDCLDTSYWLQQLYPIVGECIGSTSGHPRNTGISPINSNAIILWNTSVHVLLVDILLTLCTCTNIDFLKNVMDSNYYFTKFTTLFYKPYELYYSYI